MSGREAAANEVARGLGAIASGETSEGFARFAAGVGRHGSPIVDKWPRSAKPGDMAEDDDERLARLRDSLGRARATRETEGPRAQADRPQPRTTDSGASLAMRAGSEFVSAIIVGAAIGWGLDRLLGTNPLLLIVFFFVGVAAGILNVIRLTSPKGGGSERDSRLSQPEAADKGLQRSGPGAAPDAWRGGASGRTNGAGEGADDED